MMVEGKLKLSKTKYLNIFLRGGCFVTVRKTNVKKISLVIL